MAPTATIFPDTRERAPGSDRERTAAVVARCVEATAEALRRAGAASERELTDARRIVEDRGRDDQPVELLDVVARIQGTDEERMGPAMARLATAVASTMLPAPPMVPFAGKLIAPSMFYESFQQILGLGRALLAPVLFAEDSDAIGAGAVNPIAARLLADEIHSGVERRFGIKPYISVVRLDYESWSFLIRKHFGL